MSKKLHKKRSPTFKQRKFLKLYLKNGNATEAAMQVYDVKDRHTANVMGSQNLVKLGISEILHNAGITDEKLAQVMSDGLDANRVISARIVITKSDDPTVADQRANTKTDDFIEIPDHAIRHKFMETAYKLKGQLSTNQPPIVDNRKMYILLPPEKKDNE